MPARRKVVKMDSRTGRKLCVYRSLAEAAACTGQSRDQIYRCAQRRGYTYDSFYWRWPEDVDCSARDQGQRKKKLIACRNMLTGETKVFQGARKAAAYMYCSVDSVYKGLSRGRPVGGVYELEALEACA